MLSIIYMAAIVYTGKLLQPEDIYAFDNRNDLNNLVKHYKYLEENGECKIIVSNKIINHPKYE